MAQVSIPPCQPDCSRLTLERIYHPENGQDWDAPGSTQGYQVWRCKRCRCVWGQRYQWDAGTGMDDRWHNFGQDPPEIKRHY